MTSARTSSQATRPTWRRRVLRTAGLCLACYVGIMLLMMFLERSLIFFPSRAGDWDPAWVEVEDAHFEADDGTRLHGWYFEAEDPRAVLLFAHGNAGNLASPGRVQMMQELRERFGVSGLIFDYRGYGRSEGEPDEAGILQDARAARSWLSERAGVAETDIVLMGRSLGGGVVVDLAARDGARGLILQSAFTSLPDTAAYHYPWLPVRWLMRTRLNSLAKIGDYPGPVLQSHGTADDIIPFALGQRLHEAVPDAGKQFVALKGYGHNDDLMTPEFARQLQRFLDRLAPGDSR